MNVAQILPFDFHDHKIRTVTIDSSIYFTATDVCKVLGLSDAGTALRKLDDDEKQKAPRKIYGVEGGSDVWIINESGLYALIMRSTKPEAKTFRKWVTNEVLPRLRKSGTYSVTNYTLEQSGQLAMFPQDTTVLRNEVKRQMMEVALSTRSTKVRKLLQLLKPIVFAKTEN